MSNVLDTPYAHDAYESVSANGNIQYLIKKSSVGKQQAMSDVAYVQSTSGTSSVFTGSNIMTSFLLPTGASNELDICEKVILQITLRNDHATAACSLLPLAFMLNRYELLSGSQIELLYSQNLVEYRLFYSANDEEILNNQVNENYSYSAAAGFGLATTTLAAGVTDLFFIELPSLLSIAQPALKSISQQLTLNCYWNQKPYTSASLSTSVSMQQARIYMIGYTWEQAIAAKIYARYAQLGHYMFYNSYEWTIVPGESINPTSKSSTRLNVFSSRYMSDVMLSITANAAQQEAQFTGWASHPLALVDEKNAGTSLFSDSLYIDIYRQFAQETFWTTAPESVNIYLLPHSTDVYKAIGCGKGMGPSQRGGFQYTPNVVLELQSTTWTEAVTVTITGHAACILKIQNGVLTKSYV